MRRRSTFIPSPEVDYDPSAIQINGRRLSFAGLNAAREERLTFGLGVLPNEIVRVLKRSHELHIRWVSEEPYQKSSPYLSALTPGLHVHYTPLLSSQDDEGLCQLLKDVFSASLKCSSPNTSFSRPHLTSERFASAASLQYYTLLPSLQNAVGWLEENVCPSSDVDCRHNVALLNVASYVDLDYDALSHALILTAFWSKPPPVLVDPVGERTANDGWNLVIDASPSDRNELGILRSVPATEPSHLQMEGFLTVVGEDDHAKPTMFTFPSRHHALPQQQYTVSFDHPTGLHPTLRLTFPSSQTLHPPPDSPNPHTCALHAYLTFPSALFADEYAFPSPAAPDPLFTAAHHIRALHSITGERDLEIPDYATRKWGSALLLELATPPPSSASSASAWNVTVPLHLRYLAPSSNSSNAGQQVLPVPHPHLFWTCADPAGSKFSVNPFDRVNLGFDGLFGARSVFFHLQPSTEGPLVHSLNVPVLNSDVLGYTAVELLTAVLVLVGFLYVALGVLRQFWGSKGPRSQAPTKKTQ